MQTLTLKRQIHFASDRIFSTTTFRDLVFSCRSLWSQQWRVIWFKKQTPIVRVTSEQLRYTEQASACSATVTYGSSHSTFTLSHVSNVNDDHESHLKTRSITSDPNLIVQVILISTCEIRIHCYESLFFPPCTWHCLHSFIYQHMYEFCSVRTHLCTSTKYPWVHYETVLATFSYHYWKHPSL